MKQGSRLHEGAPLTLSTMQRLPAHVFTVPFIIINQQQESALTSSGAVSVHMIAAKGANWKA